MEQILLETMLRHMDNKDVTGDSVLGLARTGLIFTRIQEGAQPGGGG